MQDNDKIHQTGNTSDYAKAAEKRGEDFQLTSSEIFAS